MANFSVFFILNKNSSSNKDYFAALIPLYCVYMLIKEISVYQNKYCLFFHCALVVLKCNFLKSQYVILQNWPLLIHTIWKSVKVVFKKVSPRLVDQQIFGIYLTSA